MRKLFSRRGAVAAGAVTAVALALAACSSSSSPSSTSRAAAGSGQVVHLTFTDWDNGMPAVVGAWNKAHPDIQVQLIKPTGTGYTLYNKLITDNRAGTNPDISEIEYQALPEMVANHVAVSLNKYLPSLSASYPSSITNLVQFQGQTYGVPQNICPMVLFYRQDVFTKLGLKPPATWAQYAADAAKIHQANPKEYLGNFDAADPEWFAGLAQQAGANWWTASGNTWTVAINDPATQKVANYWQGLVKSGVISPEPSWSTQWLTDMNKGNLVGWISAQWAPNQFPTIAPSTAGHWVAVPLPAWTAGDTTVGTWGGEAEVVTASSKYPQQAAEFINWMNDSQQGLNLLIKNVAVFPAATFAQSSPALQTPPAFMSNQAGYNALMASVAKGVRGFQIWGPDASVTFSSYSDSFASALQNHTSFTGALSAVQTATVSDMKNSGFQVTG
ncbi:MAG TPA: sugar ABC transporter substrate-binding protein [Trebonia sp.]|nr:sugar ABC transporter substrate-binding protein [Trebonia sp.]